MEVPPRSQGSQQVKAYYSPFSRQLLLPAQEYFYSETVGGLLLLITAAIALIWANSPWSSSYFAFREIIVSFRFGQFTISDNLQHWVNSGLMAIFFFLVALEIKREIYFGSLSAWSKAAFPAAAALGGMIVPAVFFILINLNGEGFHGWGIPMATDIAFAVAIISLLGDRIPGELRVLVLTFATADDIGTIFVIAVYYTKDFSWMMIELAVLLLVVVLAARRFGVKNIGIYVLLGFLFWLAVLRSGIHATIAGVILGVLTPVRPNFNMWTFASIAERRLPEIRGALEHDEDDEVKKKVGELNEISSETESPLEYLERVVRPWVNYTVLPIFALMNAGFILSGDLLRDAYNSAATHGVFFGLFLGKPAGMMIAAWLAVRFKIASLPKAVNWKQIFGIGIIGGVGFTVSIFMSELAFDENANLLPLAHIGIFSASVLAALTGYGFLRLTTEEKRRREE